MCWGQADPAESGHQTSTLSKQHPEAGSVLFCILNLCGLPLLNSAHFRILKMQIRVFCEWTQTFKFSPWYLEV